MVIWIKTRNGESIRLVDKWHNSIYVSADSKSALEWLARHSKIQPYVSSTNFVKKREYVFDYDEREVLQLVLKRADETERLAKIVEGCSEFGDFRIYNADLLPAQAYFIEKNIFALALVRAESVGETISWKLLNFIEDEEYELPNLKKAILRVEVNTSRAVPRFSDPIRKITIFTDEKTIEIEEGDEKSKLLSLVEAIKELDPDLLFIEQGDTFTTHYLVERAIVNRILSKLILSRDAIPLRVLQKRGTSYFAYGRILHTPTSHQLYGRINLDSNNFFVFEGAGLDGLFEVVRLCRMPLHKGSRASIGKCLSSIQFAIAYKDNLLIPWKPSRTEIPKTGKTLLAGDRGGFIYEPKIGIHEYVGEIDFTSLYPYIMVNYNISAETVLCKCCKDSKIRVPDVDFNICTRRRGIIPKSLELMLSKRVRYKEKKNKTDDPELQRKYSSRLNALKGIGVCSFGYLSYRNAKFGLIDCHIAVCAFARKILLETARIAERRGFEVVHGIIDSLWVKKPRAKKEDFEKLCEEVRQETGLPLSFEGVYKWIAFLPSRMHGEVPVLNRYFGVFEDGSMKLRGIDLRRRDTIKLVADCQMEILELFSFAETLEGVRELIPSAMQIVSSYASLIRQGRIPVSDLIIVSRLSKNFNEYTGNLTQVAAVRQLAEEGLELMAGESVSYVITKFKSRIPNQKVRPVQLLNSSVRYDKDRYVELLIRGALAVLEPFDVDAEKLRNHIEHKSIQTTLTQVMDFYQPHR